VKAIAKFTNEITKIYTADIEKDMQVQEKEMNPLKDQTKLLNQEGKAFIQQLQEKQKQNNERKDRFDLSGLDESALIKTNNGSNLLSKRSVNKLEDHKHDK
jgi:hypothetical protein